MFRKEVLTMQVNITTHLLEKSPMKNAVVRFACCFDPNYMLKNQEESVKKFGLLMEKFLILERIKSANFDKFKQRLDVFLCDILSSENYGHVYYVLQIICTLITQPVICRKRF